MTLRIPLRGLLLGVAVTVVLLTAAAAPASSADSVPAAPPPESQPAATSPAGGLVKCEVVNPATGGPYMVVCPDRLAGLTDLPTSCGYLSAEWCAAGGGGTPTEMLERELVACAALPEDAPLGEVISSQYPTAIRGAFGQHLLPTTINLRRGCELDVTSRLNTLTAPNGWFNSDNAPRTSAGFPMTTYPMYYRTEGLLTLHRPVVGMFLSLAWQGGQVALRVAMWAFDWAVGGHVTQILTGIPAELAGLLQEKVVSPLRLVEVGLLLLAAAAGWQLIRSRVADAAGSLLFGLLALSFGLLFLVPAVFNGYYNGARHTRQLLAEGMTLGVIDGAGATGGLDAAAAMQVVLDSAIHQPWEQLNFGRELKGDCVAAAKRLLVDGIRSQSAADLGGMRSCENATAQEIANGVVPVSGEALADFAENPSGERLFGTVFVVAGQVAIAVLIFGVAVLALLSEVMLAAAFAALPLVVALVVWPGGRRVAGAWLSLLLRGLVGFAAGMLFLSLVMTVLAAVVGRTQGMALMERSLAFVLVTIAAVKLRKVFPKAAAQISASLGGKVSAAFSQQGGRGLAPGALVGAAGGLAGGLAASYFAPGRVAARGTQMAARGVGGTIRRTAGLTAAGLNAAAASKLARAGNNPDPNVTGPGRVLRAAAAVTGATRGGHAALAGHQATGVVSTAAQAAAQTAATRLAGKTRLAGERAAAAGGRRRQPRRRSLGHWGVIEWARDVSGG